MFIRLRNSRIATRRATNLSQHCACIALVCMVVAGCQTPGTMKGFGLPGLPANSASQPSVAPAATATAPTATPPAVAHVTDHFAPAGLPAASASTTPVAQVGFVDRLRAARCGRCAGCVQGGTCQSCQSCGPNAVAMLGRPLDPQEFICNGDDLPPEARVLISDRVGGLNPQDAVVHYTTEAGDVKIQPSNRVCLYSPRFGSVRQVTGAVAGEKAEGLANASQPVGPTGIGLTQPSLMVQDINELARADVARRVDAMRDRNRGVPVEGIVQPVIAEDALQILATLDAIALNRLDESQIAVLQRGAVAAQSWMIRDAVEVMVEDLRVPTLTRDVRVEAFVEYDFPDAGRLQIAKVADRDHAQQGEEVRFAISVRNVGDSPVHNVRIADSLVPRLEYVDDSQTCDREANFISSTNEAGSARLEWTLTEPLAVGEGATIEFTCRVR